MDQQSIAKFFAARRAALDALVSLVSPNFHERVMAKINHEEELLLMILHGLVRKEEALQQYSLVLDPRYFEQKLIEQ